MSSDARQVGRLLALAAIYDGANRTEAAEIGGVTLQVVRDWVLRFNAQGPAGLEDRKAPGQPARLNEAHRAALAAMIESGPIPAVHSMRGVVPKQFTAAYWRMRVEEARTLADEMHDPEALRIMLGIAAGYERMAERLEILHSDQTTSTSANGDPHQAKLSLKWYLGILLMPRPYLEELLGDCCQRWPRPQGGRDIEDVAGNDVRILPYTRSPKFRRTPKRVFRSI